MRPSLMRALFLCVGALQLIGCAQEKSKSQAVPAREAIYKVSRASAMGTCPEVKGTYSCHADDGDDFESSFLLVSEQPGQYHFSMWDKNPDLEEMLFEQYAFDRGGFILNGEVQDKTQGMHQGIEQVVNLNLLSIPGLAATFLAAGINLEAELKKITSHMRNFNASYVGSCNQDIVRIQYAFGDFFAVKMDIRKQPDDTIMMYAAASEDRGPIKRTKAICKRISTDVHPRKTILNETITRLNAVKDALANGSTAAASQVLGIGNSAAGKLFTELSYPDEIRAVVADSERLTKSEVITVKLERHGLFSGRHWYEIEKAYLGDKDNFFSDDVDIEPKNRKVLFVDLRDRTLRAGNAINDRGQIVGSLKYNSDKTYVLEFDSNKVNLDYENRTLTARIK